MKKKDQLIFIHLIKEFFVSSFDSELELTLYKSY
jgi:hypothetical protein